MSRSGVVRGLLEIPIIAGLAVLIVVVLRAALVQPFYIPSPSMYPQLKVNDKILVSRTSYRLHDIRRGDIVVFDQPPGASLEGATAHRGPVAWVTERLGLTPRTDELVKRVVGLPGDTVEGHDNHVYVNGHLLIEPYLSPLPAYQTGDFKPRKVPKGMLFVMGDNRTDSYDSRFFGPIRISSVVGRAVLKVWPLDHVSFL